MEEGRSGKGGEEISCSPRKLTSTIDGYTRYRSTTMMMVIIIITIIITIIIIMVITRGTNVRSAMLNNNNRLSIFLGKRFETWRGEGRDYSSRIIRR